MKPGRYLYYVFSLTLSVLATGYCILVFRSGQYGGSQLGPFFLIGIPNFYFFYTIVLPVMAAGVMYLAFENKYIRFFGELSNELGDEYKRKIRRFRTVFLWIAVLVSVLIVIQDAANKDYPLPPNAFDLKITQDGKKQVLAFYGCLQQWIHCERSVPTGDPAKVYLESLQAHGFKGQRVSGFDSIPHWYSQSSGTYKFESFLSFLAALITSVFFAEVFLLIMVKDYVKPATKNLIIWLAILVSFWFPTKMYSAWYFSLDRSAFSPPIIFWFGIVVLVIGALLVFFIRTERNNLNTYASIAAAAVSASISGLSYFKPKIMEQGIQIIEHAGWVYDGVLAVVLIIALFLVTDYFITDYEQEISH